MLDLTPDQLRQIESLGIKLTPARQNAKLSAWPILSISSLTLVSFGGIFLLKSRLNSSPIVTTVSPLQNAQPSPTQVPKSIQHYLLTSQQYFTQALQAQSDKASVIDSLNQAILAASDAIKEFPDDYRGYEQRGRIYQSLIDSQPQLLASAIADFSAAAFKNPSSAGLTRTLASLYARRGDSQSTLNYLTATINLDPTTAQNFYDLAHLQQQVGLIPQALATYDRLLTIVSDPTQKQAVTAELSALEKLVSQNPAPIASPKPSGKNGSATPPISNGPLIQADAGLPAMVAQLPAGLIIAAPETSTNVTVSNLSTSYSQRT